MASTHKHIRSGTANKRPTTAIADGQIALNTNLSSPGLFFKDSTGAEILKIGPVHVGATAPNASPAGSAGNSTGEIWLDTSLTPVGVKIWNGSAFVNATPIGSTTVQGLLELATDAETQAGADTARAVTSASLQSKLSDSTSTTSNTTIASSTAVKAAYDLANAALPKTGGTVTGNLEIGTAGSLSFEGATADGFETTIAITDPTADRTITLPNTTGTVVTTGDSGTVTSTMLLDGTIVDADINASAAIAYSKLASLTSANILVGNSSNVATSTAVTGDVTISNAGVTAISAGAIVNADVNASAAIAGSKISPDFGAQNVVTTGTSTAGSFTPTSTTVPAVGVYSPGANRLGITTNTVERVEFGTSEVVFNDDAADYDFRIEGDTNSNLFFADASAEAVGIRTATPVSELNVSVGNGGNITISNTNDAHSAGLAFGDTTSNSSGRISYDHSTNALAVATNGTGKLFIDASGNIGVAAAASTWNLGNTLEVGGTKPVAVWNPGDGFNALSNLYYNSAYKFKTTGGYGLYYQQNTANGAHIFATTTATGSADGTATFSETLRITSGGLVGIGTSSPIEALTVNGRVQSQWNVFVNGGTTSYSGDATSLVTGSTTGMWAARSDSALLFSIGSNEKVRIDSSGRVGIGTQSPNALLDVRSATTWIGDGTTDAFLQFNQSATAANRWHIGTGSGNALIFYKGTYGSGSETARLDSTGNLLVGQTAVRTQNSNSFDLNKIDGCAYVNHVSGSASGNLYAGFGYSTGNIGSITQSGTTAVLYNVTSDQRLKENIVDAPEFGNVIDSIQVRSFDWITDQTHQRAGFIAQELVTVAPEAVHQPVNPDEMMAVDYSKLVPMLVKEIQSLRTRLAAAGIE